jgi:vitamin-K-epoxide reductase (warfarin-sensitive)
MSVIAVLALAGAAISCVSLYHHLSKSKTSFCDIGQSFNCDIVNRSSYSVVAGVPVALIGILGYGVILALCTVYREKAETPIMLLIAAVAGLLFAIRLTYIEAHVLRVWCILCLSSFALITAIAVLSSVIASAYLQRERRS